MANTECLQQGRFAGYQQKVIEIEQGSCDDIFSFLGCHLEKENQVSYRVYLPNAQYVQLMLANESQRFNRYKNSDLFYLEIPKINDFNQYQLNIQYAEQQIKQYDCYSFPSALDEEAMYLFSEGTLAHAHRHFGCQKRVINGIEGIQFSLWAPNVLAASLITDANHWDPRVHLMRKHPASGVWDIFIPQLTCGLNYKYSLLLKSGERIEKADPFAFQMQQAPNTSSVVCTPQKIYQSAASQQQDKNKIDQAITIYEVHLGSWRRKGAEGQQYLSYRELAAELVEYVIDLAFTHVQLMPISEYPFDGSWGYQPVGLFSPTSRFGNFDDFCYLISAIKSAGLGVIIDWVPAHFPADEHGLAKFDGTHLYEHADTRQGFHPDWKTLIFNYERPEVRSYLLSNATYWLEFFEIDGLRVDAVASMLYLDYSRENGSWVPNCYGGRENLSAVSLIQQINQAVYQQNPNIMMVAEESTAWQGVTNFTANGGLGFGYKWNMGWMNDSLSYMSKATIHRKHHHHEMTFSMVYAHSENFILPLSHDEVVHGKGSLINKMPGDDWQKFANLRCYFGYMWAHPGKKLLFMGGEFAQYHEWSHQKSLDWHLLNESKHLGVQNLIRELNLIYRKTPALYQDHLRAEGFRWIDSENCQQSIFSFIRFDANKSQGVICISNMTPQVYENYQLGVISAKKYQLILNTDEKEFGGSGVSPGVEFTVENKASHGFEQSIRITIAPLASYYLLADIS
ncbi:MAG: 1,4-alpha-glucan branching protein GlgB [Colwellia sp.]|nr:1,4-alpha-glucan branching protein GlgB [Colwellia sp.]